MVAATAAASAACQSHQADSGLSLKDPVYQIWPKLTISAWTVDDGASPT